jgi:hypothetical protein
MSKCGANDARGLTGLKHLKFLAAHISIPEGSGKPKGVADPPWPTLHEEGAYGA